MSTSYARVNEEVPSVEPLLRVTTGPHARKFYRLASGKRGNLQTAAVMANLVREDAVRNKRLEMIATRILTDNGLDSHSDPYEIADVIFRYVQRLTYIYDPAGSFDSVQSAEQVLLERKGDCDDLSVLLATLLAMVGFKPRFVMAKYKDTTDGFDHVYVDLELARGRVALDPSSKKHGIGWESPKAIERVAYPIFDGRVVGLGEIARKAQNAFRRLTEDGRPANKSDQRSTVYGSLGCDSDCGALRGANGQTRGAVTARTLAGVSLSLPAILFGSGVVIISLKAVDYVLRKF